MTGTQWRAQLEQFTQQHCALTRRGVANTRGRIGAILYRAHVFNPPLNPAPGGSFPKQVKEGRPMLRRGKTPYKGSYSCLVINARDTGLLRRNAPFARNEHH